VARSAAAHDGCELSCAPTERNCELIEEADLAKEDLPRRAGPFCEEVDLRLPIEMAFSLLGSQAKGYLRRPRHPRIATDPHRYLKIGVRLNRDLPRNTRCSKAAVTA